MDKSLSFAYDRMDGSVFAFHSDISVSDGNGCRVSQAQKEGGSRERRKRKNFKNADRYRKSN